MADAVMSTDQALASAVRRVGTTVDGKYRIHGVIGLGGMGVVYEAQHLFLGRLVAVKVLHPRYEDAHEAAMRFLREARASGYVLHRTIVEVVDAGFVDGTTPYLVMERLFGESLRDRIVRRKALRVEQAATVFRELLKGLCAAHSKGVIHCDLKPENVFLVDKNCDFGNVKILDFGIARMAHASTVLPHQGEPRAGAGTPSYMSPEQAAGRPLDARTDLYATGAVIYEALAGAPAFPFEPQATIFQRVRKVTPPRLVGLRERVPDALAALVASLMEKSAASRPASAQEALRLLDDTGIVAAPASLPSIKIAKPTRNE